MTLWTPSDDGHADLASYDTFVAGPPFNTFKRLRDEDPLHWTDWSGGRGFWSATRYEDIISLNAKTAIFSSAHGIRMEDQSPEEVAARRTFQEIDPPDHMKTRIKLARAFSKGVIEQFHVDIRELFSDILDETLEEQTFDATRRIARELPMRMMGRIIGTPDEALAWLVEKGDQLIANTDPEFTDHVLDKMTIDEFRLMPFNSPAGAELYAYAKDLMDHKARTGDKKGVLHLTLEPGKDGSVISETQFRNFFVCCWRQAKTPPAIPSQQGSKRFAISPNCSRNCAMILRSGQRPLMRSSAGPRPRSISGARRWLIMKCTVRPSAKATRCSTGLSPAIATSGCLAIPTALTSR